MRPIRWTDLLDEGVRSVGAEQQDGSAERVSVPIELLRPHGGEEIAEDFTDVPVHSLQGHVHALPGRLVQKPLQAADIWRNGRKDTGPSVTNHRVRRAWKCGE